MKKQEIARENTFSSVGRVTVAVYLKADTDKQTLSTVLFSNKSKFVPGISAQMTYRPGRGRTLEESVKNVIARTVAKYETACRPQREHIDYAQAYGYLPGDVKHQLCPAQWRAENTRRAALTYYERRSIPILQRILDRIDDPSTLEEAQQAYLALARKNTDRGEANALATANKHITEANLLYEASRYLLSQYDLPPIEIPLFTTESIVPPEQAKALPRDDLVRLAELIRLDSSKTPLAAGAALMLCCLLRPAEVCPKYGEIVDCDNFGVYAAVHNISNGERVSAMKTRNAYRQVILPKYVMDIFRDSREVLCRQGYSDDEINDAYVIHHRQDIHRPADPQDISRYVKNKLELLGYNSDYWLGLEMVVQVEPDMDDGGNALTDVTAYLLRRSGCTYLCNCASVPLPDGRSVMPHGLVDALMGHRLRNEDAWWADWINREDNWPVIAQVLEGIILDPDHSAHPAFASALPIVSPQVCHVTQSYVVPQSALPGSTITITVRCHDCDRVDVRLPKHIQLARENRKSRTTLSRQQSCIPDIQELVAKEYYDMLKKDAKKSTERLRICMKRKNDPFSEIKITPQSGKQSFVFDYRPSIKIRFTLNPTTSAGYLARGTIGLLDPQTGHLLQTHTNSKERRFSDAATLELYVPYPRPGETQEQIIHRTVMKRTEDLLKRYRHVLNTSFREGKSLDKISLSTAVELYAADYVNDQSSSAEIRKTYYNQLRKLAISFESKKLKDLTSKDFKDFCDAHQRKNGLEYIKRLCHFLMTVFQREGVECPAKKKLEEYIRRQERNADTTNRRLQREAATTDVLPAEYEAALDDRCWRELGQPMEALSVLLKESGLSAKEVCALQWGDLLLDDADHERIFVRYRRDDLASYTHNYTFPLSPYGALYVNAWRAYLEKKCPAERLADSAYIVSQDELGQKAFASGELITYIRTTVSAYTIGYAGRIKLEGMASALGVQLFRNTRRNHLIEDCGLRDDPGALAFLMHQSMTGQVQSDSYRSFTDTTGQQYLYSKLRRDRHGCPTPEKENTRTSIVLLPDGRQEIRIPPVSGSSRQGDALITLVLTNVQPGDVIEVHALGGCFLNVSNEQQL